MTSTAIDFESIKTSSEWGGRPATIRGSTTRCRSSPNYWLQIIAELLVEAADVRAGQRALDVACGQGNAAIAAARRFAEATGVDYAANLLAQGASGLRSSTCRRPSSRATPRNCPSPTPHST